MFPTDPVRHDFVLGVVRSLFRSQGWPRLAVSAAVAHDHQAFWNCLGHNVLGENAEYLQQVTDRANKQT